MKEPKYTKDDLKIMQAWSLERKIRVTQTKIMEWYMTFEGGCYISFSGGKDSTVLLDLARRIYPDIPAVFVDTGLEFPEVRDFAQSQKNVQTIRPSLSFYEVIKKYGYPIISKDVSMIVYGARHSKHKKQSYINRLKGLNPDGSPSEYKRTHYARWEFLLDAPFEISNRCCYYIKEKPCIDYEKQTGRKAIIATMAEDSRSRKDGYLKTGCNDFQGDRQISKPLGFWTEQDILRYLKITGIPYSPIYGEIVEQMTNYKRKPNKPTGKLFLTGEPRTGCMFCMYGCHLDKENRFQRMKETHPRRYNYCINGGEHKNGMWIPNKQGLGEGLVLDYINTKY